MRIDLSRKKILIVDDIAEMRSAVKRMLAAFGAKDADTAGKGKDALNLMTRKVYDIVLCDYNLGEGKDGQQVLEEARHKELIGYSTVFIMITAENTMDAVMAAVEYNPDDYLTKPFTKEALGMRLEKALQKKNDLEEIELAAQKKEYRRAVELCDAKIAASPGNLSELLRIKAGLCINGGLYEEAIRIYEGVLATRDVPWAKLGLGKARYLMKSYLEARDIFEDLTRRQRDYMEAYDWLAKSLEEQGANEQAQAVLSTAVEMSPKAILRLKALGDLALTNKDPETAERVFRKVVTIGKESIYRSPSDFAKLAKSLTMNRSGMEALKVLQAARKEIAGNKEGEVEMLLAEGLVLRSQERGDEARRSIEEAARRYETMTKPPYRLTIEMAKGFFAIGETGKGMALMREVVLNHSEDEKVMRLAQEAFEEAGMGADGRDLISTIKTELVQFNNKGVHLVKEGKLEEAIQYFIDAVKGMAGNKTVNLNAAQVMLSYMQRNGRNDRYMYQVRECLERVQAIDPADRTLRKLSDVYYEVFKG